MDKKFNRTNAVLLASFCVFVFFVGVLIFQQARGSDYTLNRSDVIKFFTEKINEIAPDKPVSDGKWSVTRFRFVNENNVYVEYEDGHITRAFLLSLEKKIGSTPDYKIIGFFEPGALGYTLLAGEDRFKDKPQEVMEYNQTVGKWIKVN
ncbi:MAG: hypothetical protein Q8Q95_00680 [bacterium]|nr:hypothetical protein [bacterium]